MARPPKEFQAFTSLVDKLLKVPKDEILRREAAYKRGSGQEPAQARAEAEVTSSASARAAAGCHVLCWRGAVQCSDQLVVLQRFPTIPVIASENRCASDSLRSLNLNACSSRYRNKRNGSTLTYVPLSARFNRLQ